MEPGARYFADENALGLAKVLIRVGRTDIVHPGHPTLPDVPLGTLDLDWMREIANRDLIVLSRDRRIRSRPAELAAYREFGIRSVWLGAKRDLRPQEQADMFLAHEESGYFVRRSSVGRVPGHWR
jgi:hypothetical protein